MHKTWAVIRREFIERVRTRQFLIGTVLGPILMGVLIMAPILLQRNTRVKHLVVLDAAQGQLGSRVELALVKATREDKPGGAVRYRVERVVAGDRPLEAVRDSLVAMTDRRSPPRPSRRRRDCARSPGQRSRYPRRAR